MKTEADELRALLDEVIVEFSMEASCLIPWDQTAFLLCWIAKDARDVPCICRKGVVSMRLLELYIWLQPLTSALGTICLIVLAAAGTLYAAMWILNRIWKYLLAAGVLTVILALAKLVLIMA